ncbi:MAG: succinic semialdehyde dehydrogenase [Rhodoluna sp.]|nr:succinic semialdehyde dehydrogenase [Rhodoluna sp.]
MTDTSIQSLLSHFPSVAPLVPVINPSTGKRIFDLPQLSAEDVREAVQKARAFAPTWSKTPAKERQAVLTRLHDLMLKNEDKLLDVLQLETGKSRAHAFEEFAGAAGAARYYGRKAAKFLKPTPTRAGVPVLTRTWVEYESLGVVGIITPWNYPMALCTLDVLPALAAGNTVVQKADNQTALTSLFCRMLAIEAGLPASAWTIVVGDGAEVGNAITDNCDYVAFTGSTATGRKVAERAAARLIGFSLELGGKNPMLVLPSAKLDVAAELAIGGGFGSAGQLCVSIERIYVENSRKAEFLEVLGSKVESLIVGKSTDFSVDIGSLTSANQLARVSGFVQDAVKAGATVVAGGIALPEHGPYFYAPTVLTDVAHDSPAGCNEIFGPVLVVFGYDNVEEAITLANDTEYGLNASVVGKETEAILVASKLNAGSVNVNEGFRATFASMDSPMGGMKKSGKGRRNGRAGLIRFTDQRTVGVAAGWLRLPSRGRHYNRMAPLLRLLSKILNRVG